MKYTGRILISIVLIRTVTGTKTESGKFTEVVFRTEYYFSFKQTNTEPGQHTQDEEKTN